MDNLGNKTARARYFVILIPCEYDDEYDDGKHGLPESINIYVRYSLLENINVVRSWFCVLEFCLHRKFRQAVGPRLKYPNLIIFK